MEKNPNYTPETETALDRIRASFFSEADDPDAGLSLAELEQKGQLVCAHASRTQGKSLERTVKLLCGRYDISRATAYRRCRDASVLFGEVTRTHKEGERQIVYEMAQRAYRDALKLGDAKAMNGAIANMIKIKGLDKEDTTALTPELLGDKNYYLQVGQGSGKSQRVIDLGKLETLDEGTYAEVVHAVEASDLPLAGMERLLLEAREEGESDDEDECAAG